MPKKLPLSVIISIITLLALPATILPTSADHTAAVTGSTRYVANTGTDTGACTDSSLPCRSIQYAINQSASGDTIMVAAGTYTYAAASDICPSDQSKSVVCTYQKALTLLGGFTTANWSSAYPALNPTIIDGQNTYRGVRHYSYSSTSHLLDMEGFTIRNGRSAGTSTRDAMGGGLIALRASLILRDMVFENNQAIGFNTNTNVGGKADGAAIRIQSEDVLGSTALLQRVVVRNNQTIGGPGTERGGVAFGALFIYRAVVTIEDSSFTNNLADAGDTISGDGSNPDWVFADALGGGITVMNASLTMTRVNVIGNEIRGGNASTSGIGGGAFGGGIFVEGVNDGPGISVSTINMSDCYVADNLGTSGSAGTGGNTAGGGFDAVDSQVTIDRSQFINNTIKGGDGPIKSGPGSGGGLYIFAIHSGIPRATLRNVVIADNYANQGGGTTSPYYGGGGGLFVQGIGVDITHATIARNRLGPIMTGGKAFYIELWPGPYYADVNINYSIISDHSEGAGSAYLGIVTAGNTVTFNQGVFAANGSNSIFSGGAINGLGTMTSASTAGYIYSPANNYHLRFDSPAKDTATTSTTGEDYDGQVRPFDSIRDYGADEYYRFLLFAGIGDSTLQVDWARDIAYLEGGVDHYKLTVNCSSNPPDQVGCNGTINVGLTTHFTLTGLSNNNPYTMTVRAYNASDDFIAESYQVITYPRDILLFFPIIMR